MIHVFGRFELDTARMELRADGDPVSVEPQVFALLRLLVENRDRMVTKDEIVSKIWGGRIVSDAAIASRVKSARQAIGDDGQSQTAIRTVRGLGFSFVAKMDEGASARVAAAPAEEAAPPSRPRLCVLPFRLVGAADPEFPVADALPHDLITELSRLHWLFVIARGSSFRLRGADAALSNVREQLNVQYCLSGVVEVAGRRMLVSVELAETRTESIVWSERFSGTLDDVHDVRDQIVAAVVGAVEVRIQINEARQAQLRPPESLDAWAAYHLGLHHMYRFNSADNAVATALFERAIARDPGFARAHAGLSFTHFQSAFLRYEDRSTAVSLARQHAETSLQLDPIDPFGFLVMGRSHWLNGDLEGSLPWLQKANTLNANFAQARYSRGWAEALLGNVAEAQENAEAAVALSPLDPMLYGMIGTRALAHLAEGRADLAADWAERSANTPGAHALIAMMATASHGLNGDHERASIWAERCRQRAPHLTRADFLRAFPFRSDQVCETVSRMLEKYRF